MTRWDVIMVLSLVLFAGWAGWAIRDLDYKTMEQSKLEYENAYYECLDHGDYWNEESFTP